MNDEKRAERYKQELSTAIQEVVMLGINPKDRLLGSRDDVVLEVRCTLKGHLMGRVYQTQVGFLFVGHVVYDEDQDKRGRWLGDDGYPESLLLAPWRRPDEYLAGGGRLVESSWPTLLCRCRERHARWDEVSLRESAEDAFRKKKRLTYLA